MMSMNNPFSTGYVFTFGKYAGRRIEETPVTYLEWLIRTPGTHKHLGPRVLLEIVQNVEQRRAGTLPFAPRARPKPPTAQALGIDVPLDQVHELADICVAMRQLIGQLLEQGLSGRPLKLVQHLRSTVEALERIEREQRHQQHQQHQQQPAAPAPDNDAGLEWLRPSAN
jgi:uncharacterized protein (DUF3820 family)